MEIVTKYCVLHLKNGYKKSDVQSILDGSYKANSLNFKWFEETRTKDYYYIHGIGLVDYDRWKEIMPLVAQCKQTAAEWCLQNKVPRSFIKYLKIHSDSFKELTDSREYKHLLGNLQQGGSDVGKRINKRKTRNTRKVSDEINGRSYQRALSLCKKYNVTLQCSRDLWIGCHLSDGTIPMYDVKCNSCGTVYKTYFHSSTIRTCPQCHDSKFSSLREGHISEWLESLGYKVWRNNRFVINGKSGWNYEVDVYLPDLKIGFEFNGFYWHNYKVKEKDYHLKKLQCALNQGIKLYNFWEDKSEEKIKEQILKILDGSLFKGCRSKLIKVSRDLCPVAEDFLNQNKKYSLKEELGPQYCVYTSEATSKHKSHVVCRDKSKFKELLKEGFVKVYDTGAFIFERNDKKVDN